MTSDDPNRRPTLPLGPAAPPDATRTYADPSATVPFQFGPPIVGPVDAWPAGLTRYRPLHLLGDGGMGEVYLAHDAQLDRHVAIKFARLGHRPAADTADRILAEARAAARLHHPGICPVFDADVCDGVPYLTMAFVQGPTLAAELKRLGPCPPGYAARLVRAVAEAMQYAHDHGVIHRDLKPGNILLTADHSPVVSDFGLAVRTDREGLADGVISGTPHYMAPEQAAGDAAAIGERTDVFALGVILFEMLTGRTPFEGTPREVLEKVRAQPVPPVRGLRPDVPVPLAEVVARATARDPAGRFDGMAAFAEALSDHLRRDRLPPKGKAGRIVRNAVLITSGILLLWCLIPVVIGLILPAIQKANHAPKPTAAFDPERRGRAALLTEQGNEAFLQDEWGKSLAHYNEAIALDPTATEPRQRRATLLQHSRRREEALDDWGECLRLDPNDTFSREARAELLLDMKRWTDALADLDVLTGRAPQRETWLLVRRAEARYELGRYAAALEDLEVVIRDDGLDNPFADGANAHYLRALVRKATGDTVGAGADMAVAKKHAAHLSGRFAERYKNGPWPTPDPAPTPPPPPKK